MDIGQLAWVETETRDVLPFAAGFAVFGQCVLLGLDARLTIVS